MPVRWLSARFAGIAIVTATSMALLPMGGVAGASPRTAVDGAPSTPATASVRSGTDPQVVRDGRWLIVSDSVGTNLEWDFAGLTLTGGARLEFGLDGQPLGAAKVSADGKRARLFVPGLTGVSRDRLSATLGGRRVDVVTAATTSGPAPATMSAQASRRAPTQPSTLVTPDPGVAGKYATTSFTYSMPDLTIPGLSQSVEVIGQVVGPKSAPGPRPVVLFMHGRHPTCFREAEVSLTWPCASGWAPIQSLAGYRYAQQLLASRGYLTISIAANGINGQDNGIDDAGAQARSVLVRHHLNLLATWNVVAGPGATAGLRGKLNLLKVMTVGHSRGGEGVARAAIDQRTSDPFRIVGQVLLAPTDFGRQVAAGVPTTVMLPYCDGDVSDLQGQQFVDQARGLVDGDNSLVTSALMLGANHNYFNTEWTPGLASAPARDDWVASTDSTCGPQAKGRLGGKVQRTAAATYISAAADTYIGRSKTAVKLLDGTAARAKSAGTAIVLTAAVGGNRRVLLADPRTATLSGGKYSAARACPGFTDGPAAACATSITGRSPHWLPSDVPARYALAATWSASAAGITARIPTPVNIKPSTNLELRVIADPSVAESAFRLVLIDKAGHRSMSPITLRARPLPGGANTRRDWAQTLRVPLSSFKPLSSKKKVDTANIRAIALRTVSKTGRISVLDVVASNPGQSSTSISSTQIPRFDVASSELTFPGQDADHTVEVTVSVAGPVLRPARLWVQISRSSSSVTTPGVLYAAGRSEVTVEPGTTEVKVPILVTSSSVWAREADPYSVNIYPSRNALVGDYLGGVAVRSNVPTPTLIAVASNVTVAQGQPIVWELRLSAPTRFGWGAGATGVVPAAGTELTTAGLLRPWALRRVQTMTLPDGSAAPLSQAGLDLPIRIEPYATRAVLEIPTASTTTEAGNRSIAVEVASDGLVTPSPLRLTAAVTPTP